MALEDYLPYDGPKDGHPVWKTPTIWVDVQIRRNATGEVRTQREWQTYDPAEEGDTPSDYIWSEGNYGCDCNRHLFFHRAAGVEPEEDCPCGDEEYSLNVINPKDGSVMYEEFKNATTSTRADHE